MRKRRSPFIGACLDRVGKKRKHVPCVPSMINVAFNATSLLAPLTGVGQYTRNLARELQRLSTIRLRFFYGYRWADELISPEQTSQRTVALMSRLRSLPGRSIRRAVQQAFFMKGGTSRIDLYHEPNFLPFRFSGPTIITVHDLSHVRYPETHPTARVTLINRILPRALQYASHVIVPSSFVKQELIDIFRLPAEKVTATPEAARSIFRPRTVDERRATLQHYGLFDRGFLLCVGTLEPRKNVEAALNAHALLSSAVRRRMPLALVGMRGWLTSRLESLMEGPMKRGEVLPLGFITDNELTDIYSACVALVYPSIYEGFGLPVVEAMACGVPVITSDASSLPEVAGDAAIMLDPADVQGISVSMLRLIEDHSHWEDRAAASIAQASKFSWTRCAHQTLGVYQTALARA